MPRVGEYNIVATLEYPSWKKITTIPIIPFEFFSSFFVFPTIDSQHMAQKQKKRRESAPLTSLSLSSILAVLVMWNGMS
ncbi:hypothetical protein VNO80_29173 [Phaseolus coccineus]|uniref:Uncharacterized protein n=1 Tax=Phaseolus coccineus TaxID=3886 RepID=A0AAN9QER4_PHACN